ncbi:MAG TPA: GNAT family N-acetyltransferase [Herpetosiphonaceae bacterium]
MVDGETWRIRAAAPTDIDGLIELCAEHAAYEGASYDPRDKREGLFQALFSAEPRLSAWVVEQRGRLVGYATACQEFSTWDAASFLHMDCLYLRETIRGAGIGRLLVGEVVRLAQRLGCVDVQWQTPAWNERAHVFYRRLGAEGKQKVRYSLAPGADQRA